MLWVQIIFVLVLSLSQNCSQITIESSEIFFNNSDLRTSYELDDSQLQLEAFKSRFNDELFEKKETDFHTKLRWVSIGNPVFIKTTQNNISRLFHESLDGFYTFIRVLSNLERELLADKAKEIYKLNISKEQILNLPLITFQCFLNIPNYIAKNKVFIGKVHRFNQNPLRLDFSAAKDTQERLIFEELLLKSNENLDLNLDCKVQAKVKTQKTKELIISGQELNHLQFKNKLFGKAKEASLTLNHLAVFASELYSFLNIIEEYEMPEFQFSDLFAEELLKKFTTGLSHVPFFEAVSLFPRHSEDLKFGEIKSMFEQLIEIKRNEKQQDYLELNIEKIEVLKSHPIMRDLILKNIFLIANVSLSLAEQLKDLNKRTRDVIQWKLQGTKISPKSLFVAKFKRSSFSETIKFNKIKRVVFESEFEKHFRLYTKTDIDLSHFVFNGKKIIKKF